MPTQNTLIVLVAFAMAIAQFWPAISGLFSKAKRAATTPVATVIGGDPISRDAAVAGLLQAIDYAQSKGLAGTATTLGQCLPGLVSDEGIKL